MADSANAPKPSSSVKLVLLGEAAVGKVRLDNHMLRKHLLAY
jgi:Ras-related protein Rab-5C